nr:5727_t:CDS:2 [Entrophospora candida]
MVTFRDGGIDLIGAFVYEGERYVLVVQCKHCKTFPIAVRELKGVMAVYPYYTSIVGEEEEDFKDNNFKEYDNDSEVVEGVER